MRLVITDGKRKREIEAPFAICASNTDFMHLREAIEHWLNKGLSYGWIDIPVPVGLGPEEIPEPWDDRKGESK